MHFYVRVLSNDLRSTCVLFRELQTSLFVFPCHLIACSWRPESVEFYFALKNAALFSFFFFFSSVRLFHTIPAFVSCFQDGCAHTQCILTVLLLLFLFSFPFYTFRGFLPSSYFSLAIVFLFGVSVRCSTGIEYIITYYTYMYCTYIT